MEKDSQNIESDKIESLIRKIEKYIAMLDKEEGWPKAIIHGKWKEDNDTFDAYTKHVKDFLKPQYKKVYDDLIKINKRHQKPQSPGKQEKNIDINVVQQGSSSAFAEIKTSILRELHHQNDVLAKLQTTVLDIDEKIVKMENEDNDSSQAYEELLNKIKPLFPGSFNLNNPFKDIENLHNNLEKKNDELGTARSECQDKVQKINSQLDELSSLKSSNDDLSAENEGLKQKIAESSKEGQKKIEKLYPTLHTHLKDKNISIEKYYTAAEREDQYVSQFLSSLEGYMSLSKTFGSEFDVGEHAFLKLIINPMMKKLQENDTHLNLVNNAIELINKSVYIYKITKINESSRPFSEDWESKGKYSEEGDDINLCDILSPEMKPTAPSSTIIIRAQAK